MPIKTPGTHDTCQHKQYLLTCDQYEELLARCDGRCEICALPGPENCRGKLHIDHDSAQGYWAVRGLLCTRCNSSLDRPFMAEQRVAYLASAWYVGMLADHGIVVGHYTQPPVGATVRGRRHFTWKRSDHGWLPQYGSRMSRRPPVTWWDLTSAIGPHNLTVVSQPAAVSHA